METLKSKTDKLIKDRINTLIGRLINWKFGSAVTAMEGLDLPKEDQELINALNSAFSNSGWFDGNMAIVIANAVNPLIERLKEQNA